MKKLLFLIIPFLTCCTRSEQQVNEVSDANPKKANYTPAYAARFTYDEHTYIAFKSRGGYDATPSIVHDPDCPCHKTK